MNSKIEWTYATWNPFTGCTKVSEGCRNCYAERHAKRFAGRFGYPASEPFRVTFHPERLEDPLHWRKPKKIFVCSMSDLFHWDVPGKVREQIFDVMRRCPQHTFQVLTKRIDNVLPYLFEGLQNLWLGCSISNQEDAERLIPVLLRIGTAAVRFVSVEPMLGPVDLRGKLGHWTHPDGTGNWFSPVPGTVFRRDLDWVICGGESGPNARPMHPDWPRGLRDQCQAAGTPFFFKQWGEWAPSIAVSELMAERMEAEYNERFDVWRVGKKAAGRLLDGREWNEMPESEGAK